MNQAVEPRFQFHERAEIGHARNRAFHAIAHVILLGGRGPRVRLQLFQAERNPLLRRIHLQDLDVEFLPDRQHIGRLVHPAVRDIGHVQHAVHAANIDERAVIEQAAHSAVHHHADLQLAEPRFFRFGALFFENHAAVDDDVFFFGVELDDPAGDFLADQRLHLRHVARAAARSRHERAHADIDREPALDHRGDDAGNRELFRRMLSAAPTSLSAGPP